MRKFIFISLIFLANLCLVDVAYAQKDSLAIQDSLAKRIGFDRQYMPHPYYSMTKHLSLRAGLGYAKSFHTELGIARHMVSMGCAGASGSAYYVSAEQHFVKGNDPHIYAFKAGIDVDLFAFAMGMDVKYQTNFRKLDDVVITPKIGIGWACIGQLFYGYHISTNNRPFKQISRHGVSLVFQLGLIDIR